MKRGRKLGPLLATALVASNMIGSGIFLLPATLAAVGSISVFGWLIGAAGALLVAAVLARLAQVIPAAGGPCSYAANAFGPAVGFQANAMYWLSCVTGVIAIAVAAVGYLESFFPSLNAPLPGAIATAVLIWLLTLLNILGARLVSQFESVTILIGLIPILLVATLGWSHFDRQVFLASWNVSHEPTYQAVPESLVLLFWAFTGMESVSVASAVVANPSRNVPIATLGGVAIAAVVYITACTAIMGLIPAAQLARSTAPFADAVSVMFGRVTGGLIALAALTKSIGTLGGWVLMTAQTSKAAADRGLFPRLFARADDQGVPVLNLLWMAVLMSVIVFVTIAPTLGEQFGKLIAISTILCLLVYVYACLALLRYRRWVPSGGALRAYRPVALAAMVFCAVVIGYADAPLLLWTLAVMLVSAIIHRIFGRRWQLS
ncbi:MAG TPA: amino acid permease [Steroidobacteraceae bacterium]|nr:amino acid permease [Steroidobacteraceae bacterium]